ncbi:hypothetical protein BT67DRAFT_433163 [Trichocladium antarcticum]|uniref:Pathway-specific nitrogen regulator n=1 Tax=Trichocladium antarcticum TaxID=1450529 RepID=A0AAN6UN20_9PEZI|nr:hypothetical protein BT67DRAFT_433163 [Trichocladium antarcticum]
MPRKTPDLDLDFNIYVDPSCLSDPMDDAISPTQLPAAEMPEEPKSDAGTEDVVQPAEQPEEEHGPPDAQQDTPAADVPAEDPPAPAADGVAPAMPETDEPPAAEAIAEADPAPEAEEQHIESVQEAAAEDPATAEPAPEEPIMDEQTTEEPVVEELAIELAIEDPVHEELAVESQQEVDDVDSGVAHTPAQDGIPAEDADLPDAAGPVDPDTEDHECARQPSTFTDRKTSLRTEALIQAAARAVVAKIERRKSQEGPGHDDEEHGDSLLGAASPDTNVAEDADVQSTYSGYHSPARRDSAAFQPRHIPSRSTSSDDAGSSSHNEPDDDVFSDRSARSSVCSLDANDANDVDAKTPHAAESLSRRDSFASSRQSPRAISGLSTISGFSQYDKEQFVPTSRDQRMPFRTPSEIRAMQMASPTPSVFNGSPPRPSKRHSGGGLPPISRLGSPTVSAQYSPKGRSTPPRFKSRQDAPLVLLHVTLLPLRWGWGAVLNGLDGAVAATGRPFAPSDQLRTLRDAWRELQERVGDTVLERGILLPHPQNDYEVLEERLLEALELPVRCRARILECGHYLGPADEMGEAEDGGESDDEYAASSEERPTEGGKHWWCSTCRNEIRFEQLGPGKVFRVKVYASNGLMKAGAWGACWNEMERVDVEVEPLVDPALQGELEKLAALQLELEEQRRQEAAMQVERSAEPELKGDSAAEPQLRAGTPSRQHAELPSEADLSQATFMSSRPSSVMQFGPSSPAVVPFSRPSSRHTEALELSDERRRRDEDRLREIYGDMPAAAAAQTPAPTPDPFHQQPQQQQPPPPPQPLIPLQSQALTTFTSPPPLHNPHHDPHTPAQHPDPYNTRPPSPPPAANMYPPRQQQHQHQHQQQQPRRGIVLDENAGFVDILMEAFKVLLRDPKNVAIIVLCVFVVVMMKRPGPEAGTGLEVVYPPQAQQLLQKQGGLGVQVGVGVGVEVEVPVARVEGLEAEGVGGKEVEVKMEEAEEVVPVGSVAVSEAGLLRLTGSVFETGEEEQRGGEEEEEREVDLPPVVVPVVEEAAVDAPALDAPGPLAFSPLADILAAWALQYPMSSLDAAPATADTAEPLPEDIVSAGSEDNLCEEGLSEAAPAADSAEDATADAGEDASMENATLEGCAAAAEAPANDSPDEGPQVAAEHQEEHPDAYLCESNPQPRPAQAASHHSACDMPAGDDDDDDEAEAEAPSLSAPSASTTSLFIPGPLVTERKTVRVFETVTQTVRVSVVTQTETVSTVVTAVPQTVEETVYETETVRITVSVPVEERQQKGRGKAGCGGWL